MIFSLTITVCNAEEAIYDQKFLSTQDGVMAALQKKYDIKLQKVYSIYDKLNSRQILVCFDAANKKCFVSFGGKELFIRYRANGNIREVSNLFTPEIAIARLANENIKSVDGDGLLTDKINMEIGYWFVKPEKESIKILLSSSDGDFLIEWRSDEEMPRVTSI